MAKEKKNGDGEKAEKKGSAGGGGFLDRANARKLYAKINELHGSGTIGVASQVRRIDLDRFSTGSLGLDFALGGGIPAERVTLLVGQESCGKTTLALRIAADAQRRCANCLRYVKDIEVQEITDEISGEVFYKAVAQCDCYKTKLFKPRQADGEKEEAFNERIARYEENSYDECRVAFIDVEHALDLAWARTVGVDLRRLSHALPQNAEQASDIYADLMFTGMVDMLILDSIANMTPTEEIEASANDQQQGLAARIVNKWVRRVTGGSITVDLGGGRNRAPTQIWINQLRQKIGVTFGEGMVEPGGKGQRFAASAKIKLWTAKWEKKTMLDSLPERERIDIGKHAEVHWVIEKNKTGPAKGEGMFLQIASGARMGEVDEFNFVCHLAERYGILHQDEKKKLWFLGNEEYKRKNDAFDRMRQPQVMENLRLRLMKRMNEERDA